MATPAATVVHRAAPRVTTSNVNVSVTSANDREPIVKVNGIRIILTENDGTYTGSFQMPTKGTVLEINSETDEWDEGDIN